MRVKYDVKLQGYAIFDTTIINIFSPQKKILDN